MFVQIMQARPSDAEGVQRLMDRWVLELGPDAPGWLGTTAGVTHDGQLLAVVRFESEEAARRNSDRPEQGAWYEEFTKHIDGDVIFADCPEAETFLRGGSDDAGFVQVMRSRVLDRERVREVGRAMDAIADEGYRPDLIGGVVALERDNDVMTQVAYFTSEAEAREGEKTDPPEAVRDAMAAWSELVADTEYFDLRDPWMASPR